MPTYTYQCYSCENILEVYHRMNETPELECECGGEVRKVILEAPGCVIPPDFRAVGSRLNYYGIRDIQTGKGIENLKPGWNQGEPGIKVKSLKKK